MSKDEITLQARVDQKTAKALDKVAKKLGVTRSVTIRTAVLAYLALDTCKRCHGTGRES